MKAGDLIRMRQDIEEYVAIRGDSIGVILESPTYGVLTEDLNPMTKLFRVLWSSDLEIEELYEDELEVINESR